MYDLYNCEASINELTMHAVSICIPVVGKIWDAMCGRLLELFGLSPHKQCVPACCPGCVLSSHFPDHRNWAHSMFKAISCIEYHLSIRYDNLDHSVAIITFTLGLFLPVIRSHSLHSIASLIGNKLITAMDPDERLL